MKVCVCLLLYFFLGGEDSCSGQVEASGSAEEVDGSLREVIMGKHPVASDVIKEKENLTKIRNLKVKDGRGSRASKFYPKAMENYSSMSHAAVYNKLLADQNPWKISEQEKRNKK